MRGACFCIRVVPVGSTHTVLMVPKLIAGLANEMEACHVIIYLLGALSLLNFRFYRDGTSRRHYLL